MKVKNCLQTTLLVLVIGSVFSCRSEVADDKQDSILGRWDIQEATRNNRPTESLAELYFEFYEDGTMLTNLTGESEKANYEVDGERLLQRESQVEPDYLIEELTDSVLIISTRLRNIPFRFRLKKSIQER